MKKENTMLRMTEEEFGRAWRVMAIRENHKPKLPGGANEKQKIAQTKRTPDRVVKRRWAVADLHRQGKTNTEIAELLRVPYDDVKNDIHRMRNAGTLPRPWARAAE